MFNGPLASVKDHETRVSPLGRWILGNQRRQKSIVEFFYSHIQQLYPALLDMNLSGDLSFFCQKLIILNRLHLNLQVKNGSQIPVQRPNFFREGLTHSAVPPRFLERGKETPLRVNPCLPAGRLSVRLNSRRSQALTSRRKSRRVDFLFLRI